MLDTKVRVKLEAVHDESWKPRASSPVFQRVFTELRQLTSACASQAYAEGLALACADVDQRG
jgi:hypothetical protein